MATKQISVKTPGKGNVPPSGDGGNNNKEKNGGSTPPDQPEISEELWKPRLQVMLFVAIALCFCLMIYLGVIRNESLMTNLHNAETARGLITFVIALGAIFIALLACLGALMGRGKPAEKSFFRAKEVLTILVGILGTIVGFYYGSVKDEGRLDITVAEPFVKNAIGQTAASLTSFVTGGKKPYRYVITSPDCKELKVAGLADESGWIRTELKTPKVSKGQMIGYKLEVEDAIGTKGQYFCEAAKGLIVTP